MNNDFETVNSNSLRLKEVINPSPQVALVTQNIQKIMNEVE